MCILIDIASSLNKAHDTQDIYTDMITTIQNVKIHWIPFTRSSVTTNTAKMKKIYSEKRTLLVDINIEKNWLRRVPLKM